MASRRGLRFPAVLSAILVAACAGRAEESGEFFEARIRPLLSAKCYACHTSAASGGLRLDSREGILKGGATGPSIVPGRPEDSVLIQAVSHTHQRLKMPPGGKLEDHEIADLAKWVKDGAAWPAGAAIPAAGGFTITAEQRAFWSFQPLRPPQVPAVKSKKWARNPVDRFILAKLEERGLAPATPANKRTLIRRATYDLTGLPPSPEEVEAFLADKSPDAFAKVVDRLLASPRYGERWGRHWLDLVRYADTAGDSADYPIPQAHLYRDYVIESFNRDKPYDQFLREQIAGDLLPGASESERWERVVATGYLATARRFSVRPERNMHLTIEDTIDNVGKTVLGLTISCARCHDHKYDPISSKDYYALYGIFDSTRYPFAGSENDQYQKDLVTRLPQAEVNTILKPYREQLAPVDAEIEKLENERKAVTEMKSGEVAGRRTAQELTEEIRKVKKQRATIVASMPALESAYAVAEGEPHNARVQVRGEPKDLGGEAPRRFPEILGGQALPAGAAGSGRVELAQWLTDPKNPLTARVMVNRIWQHHFGRGLVTTPSDFGKRGRPPSHPELLDYLANEFVKSGWSVKALHRTILLSRTYQLSSDGPARNASDDPDNSLLSKFNRRRLDAEEIRDSLLLLSGAIDPGQRGAHPFPAAGAWNFTQHKPFAAVYESNSRTVYLMTQRIQKHPYLALFDGADTNMSTAQRAGTTTPLQALFLMNSKFVHEQADLFAERLVRAEAEDRERIRQAHLMALGRPPAAEEIRQAEQYLGEGRMKLAATDIPEYRRVQTVLASYLRALVSSNEFIFVE